MTIDRVIDQLEDSRLTTVGPGYLALAFWAFHFITKEYKNAIEIGRDGYEPEISVTVSYVRCKAHLKKKIRHLFGCARSSLGVHVGSF